MRSEVCIENRYEPESVARAQFSILDRTFEYEAGHRPVGFRFLKHIFTTKTNLNGREIIVCGEDDDRQIALSKLNSELIERLTLIDFAEMLGDRAQTSNGWAAHPNKAQAQINATLELVERDAVLSQWYSSTPFIHLPSNELPKKIREWESQELSRSEFPKLTVLLSTKGLGPSVTCIFTNENGFGVSAHSAKQTLEDSISSAIAEACRAAHASIRRDYWNDSSTLKNRISGSVEPSAHGVYYAYHEAFPSWMVGQQTSWQMASLLWSDRISKTLSDSSFNFQPVLELPVHVGFTRHPESFELRWETTCPSTVALTSGAKRLKLTTETINGMPHIVS